MYVFAKWLGRRQINGNPLVSLFSGNTNRTVAAAAEYVVRSFLPDGVFSNLVTTGCFFYISLCENSINSINQAAPAVITTVRIFTDELFSSQITDVTVQYSTVQYSTVQYSEYSTVRYGTVRYGTVHYSTVRYSTVQYT